MDIQFKMNRRVPHIGLVSCLRWPLLRMYSWFFWEHKMTGHWHLELQCFFAGWIINITNYYYGCDIVKKRSWDCHLCLGKAAATKQKFFSPHFSVFTQRVVKVYRPQKPGSMYSFTHKFVHKHPHQCFTFLANRTAPRHFQGHAKVQRQPYTIQNLSLQKQMLRQNGEVYLGEKVI